MRGIGFGLGGVRTIGEDAAPSGSVDGVAEGRPVEVGAGVVPMGGHAGCEDGGKLLGDGRMGKEDGAAELVGGAESKDGTECT